MAQSSRCWSRSGARRPRRHRGSRADRADPAWADKRAERERLNPARWRGHLDTQLPARTKVAKPKHHAALPVPSEHLHERPSQPGRIGGARTRVRRPHGGTIRRGALCDVVRDRLRIQDLDRARGEDEERSRAPSPLEPGGHSASRIDSAGRRQQVIFQSPRGGALSDMALVAVCRRMEATCVPHGFRSTFRDWCAENTNVAREVAEMALAHAVGNGVEAAYRRGDLFEKRRVLMGDWAAFCEGAKPRPRDGRPRRGVVGARLDREGRLTLNSSAIPRRGTTHEWITVRLRRG